MKRLVGATVISVNGATIYLADGRAFEFVLEGDCCSSSEYTPEGLAAFAELLGRTITDVEERTDSSREQEMREKYGEVESDKWHFLVFTTDRGHITIDWRNISNGYYDGTCGLVERELTPWAHDAAVIAVEGK